MIKFLDPIFLIQTLGLVGVVALVFAESGLLVGFFLPGDSLLFTAGFLAAQGYFNVWALVTGVVLAAIAGDSVGYWFGAKLGPKLFAREDSRFFHRRHLDRTQAFYARHGRKTVILARFAPIVRTGAPILAGVGQMTYSVFLTYNIIGGVLWGVGLTGLGYGLGQTIPNAENYLWPIVILIIILSFLPGVMEWRRAHRLAEK